MKLNHGAFCLYQLGWWVEFALFIRRQGQVALKQNRSPYLEKTYRGEALNAIRTAKGFRDLWREELAALGKGRLWTSREQKEVVS